MWHVLSSSFDCTVRQRNFWQPTLVQAQWSNHFQTWCLVSKCLFGMLSRMANVSWQLLKSPSWLKPEDRKIIIFSLVFRRWVICMVSWSLLNTRKVILWQEWLDEKWMDGTDDCQYMTLSLFNVRKSIISAVRYFLLFQSFLITLDSSTECHNIPGLEKKWNLCLLICIYINILTCYCSVVQRRNLRDENGERWSKS